jgi:starch phosphorylase
MEIRTIPVADIELPREVEPLRRLCYNLWWTWTPRARRLFSHIDNEMWARYRNPVELLINIEPHHWRSLVENETFLGLYNAVMRQFDQYVNNTKNTWFAKNHPRYDAGPVAYFSCEYGFHESIGIYSGGLGVLSGDTCKAASDFGLPFIGVGLLYKHGYFHQEIEPDGRQQHFYPNFDFNRLPLLPAQNLDGGELVIGVELPGRTVYAKVWKVQVGRVPVLLLDSDINRNDPADRPITGQLYVMGREMRLCQEIILGVGGARALRALNIEPAIWHMNEGHCALLCYERARIAMRDEKCSFKDAIEKIKRNAVFTTHTPVPAGHEAFEVELVKKYAAEYCKQLGVSMDEVIQLGLAHPTGHQPFSLTVLAIRTSAYQNAVSELHAKVSNQMWSHLYPETKSKAKPIIAITNGVHTQTWLGYHMWDLFDKYLGGDWADNLMDEIFWTKKVQAIPDQELWEIHQIQKENLIRFARVEVRNMFARHGAAPDDLHAVEKLLNPNALTIGFARRFATYKRALLAFQDYERMRALIKSADRPVQFIFAGKAHPADKEGQWLVQRIFEIAYRSDLYGHVVLLENYNMRTARMLVQGVDVWMNTPRRPREASGTSGQKAPINGGINFSVLDGWWCESFKGENGWAIGNSQEFNTTELQDHEDAQSLYDTLEKQIIPLYYQRDAQGLPLGWIKTMKASMATVTPRFSAARMIRDYITQAYLPHAPKSKKQEEAW